MGVISVLAVSALLQIIAALLAVRLILVTGRLYAWALIAAAVSSLAVWHTITLVRVIAGTASYEPDMLNESFEIAISVMLVGGIALIEPVLMDYARSGRELAERARHAEFVAHVSASLTREAGMREGLQGCCEAMVTHLGAAFARVWVLDEDGGMLRLMASAGMYTATDGSHSRIPLGEFKVGYIGKYKKPLLSNDVANDPYIQDKDWARREGMAAFAGHPLVVKDSLVGVMAMFSRRPLSGATLGMLASVADEVALGIHNYRAQEALSVSETKYRIVADNTYGWEFWLGPQGRFLYSSPSCERFTGYTADEFERDPGLLTRIIHKDDLAAFSEHHHGQEDPDSLEFRIVRKDGETRWIEHLCQPVHGPGGAFMGHRGSNRDITERRELESQRAELRSMLTHDIKSPLTAIIAYTELLRENFGDRLDGEPMSMVDSIGKGAGNILGLVEDFVTVSSLDTGRMPLRLRPVDIAGLLEEAEEEFRAEAERKRLKLDMAAEDGMPEAMLDKRQFARAISNLLRNAVNYTPEGGSVTLRAQKGRGKNDGLICISVTDTGPGIPESEQKKVFDKYYRSGAASSVRGTGLGLAIVKAIVEAHGGSVELQSTEGKGSTFRVDVPARPSA